MKRKTELALYLSKWVDATEKIRDINKYLYEHTDLFEQENIADFPEELYSFFAGKITRYQKDINQLYKLVRPGMILKMQQVKLFGGDLL